MSRSLSDWLTHLESLNAQRALQPFSQVREKRFEALKDIAKMLDVLEFDCPVVTVAGTNGKGSCITLLASIFSAAGYKVASFTSPHLLRYNERIQVNQQPVGDSALCQALTEVEKVRQDALLGYFEFTTLAGLLLFKRAKPDIVLLEVGLGGRLDPVNMIDTDIAIISSIDLDHTHILGNTIEAIAFEKAGIMRPKKPCIWGDISVPENVKTYAEKLKTPLWVYQQDFQVKCDLADNQWTWLGAQQCLKDLPMPTLTYLPNAGIVLKAIELLASRLPVSLTALFQGLRQVNVPGRYQVLEGKVKTILDVAHNPASAALLAKNLKNNQITGKILVVIAVLDSKDIRGILLPLMDMTHHWYLGQFEFPKSAAATHLSENLDAHCIGRYDIFSSVAKAYQAAIQKAELNDVVVVTGGFYTVSAVMQYLKDLSHP